MRKRVDENLSTTEVGWILGRSPGSVRRMIRTGEIEAVRIPGGFRISRDEALRLGRARIEAETGGRLSEAELVRLIDEVIETNRGD